MTKSDANCDWSFTSLVTVVHLCLKLILKSLLSRQIASTLLFYFNFNFLDLLNEVKIYRDSKFFKELIMNEGINRICSIK